MKSFQDEEGDRWSATVHEEATPRHHGRWYLVFEAADGRVLPMGEVRWQTRASAERTIATMGEAELRRRHTSLLRRAAG
jgi:hypothetical protein